MKVSMSELATGSVLAVALFLIEHTYDFVVLLIVIAVVYVDMAELAVRARHAVRVVFANWLHRAGVFRCVKF